MLSPLPHPPRQPRLFQSPLLTCHRPKEATWPRARWGSATAPAVWGPAATAVARALEVVVGSGVHTRSGLGRLTRCRPATLPGQRAMIN